MVVEMATREPQAVGQNDVDWFSRHRYGAFGGCGGKLDPMASSRFCQSQRNRKPAHHYCLQHAGSDDFFTEHRDFGVWLSQQWRYPARHQIADEDSLTQAVLASFIGSFIFSIVGMIVLRFGAYADRGRVVLFVVTIAVIALIVINLLRWIDYLTRFGRSGETTRSRRGRDSSSVGATFGATIFGGQPVASARVHSRHCADGMGGKSGFGLAHRYADLARSCTSFERAHLHSCGARKANVFRQCIGLVGV